MGLVTPYFLVGISKILIPNGLGSLDREGVFAKS